MSQNKRHDQRQGTWIPPVFINVPFCRLEGRISKEIDFELLLPQQWNGRFLMAGNGGFAGSIQNNLLGYLDKAYAVVPQIQIVLHSK